MVPIAKGFYRRSANAALLFLTSAATLFLWSRELSSLHDLRVRQRLSPDITGLPESGLNPYLFPVVKTKHPSFAWIYHNHKAINAPFSCLQSPPATCGRNQTSVVILGSFHFTFVLEGQIGGEDMWARSTVAALEKMGYTYLYSPHWDGTDQPATLRGTMELYRMLPDLVKAILVEGEDSRACFSDPFCVLSKQNPKWTLSPEDYQLEYSWHVPNTYLGYSVEPGCRTTPFVPHALRDASPLIYVMAKDMDYFKPETPAWEADYYTDAADATGAHFMVGAYGTPSEHFPQVLENVGLMPQDWFYETLSKSALLIGVGRPWTSPTMYDALCLGSEFPYVFKHGFNLYFLSRSSHSSQWDENNPTNRNQWQAQQGALKDLDPPYVYNVFKGDRQGFIKAIKDALANPIQRFRVVSDYILDRMRMGAVEERLGRILETDWKAEAEILAKDRAIAGKGKLFTI
ncbi:hypothetical protein GGX14DRAFT_700909 [Mycena pura]|uniref:Glycosyltransferase family 18 catalytic domain-containing protein n=1 Tax=Mycena pura TaxID=153505 RepID=A0AAD6UU05_9AGAR|nr:hypothetical protein GGX14DRAFT_700909 [Mycena pura]